MKTGKILSLVATSVVFFNSAQAALVIDISGTTGSNVVNYTASGSIVILDTTSGVNSTVGRAPVSGTWNSSFDNNVGDAFLNSASSDLNLALSNKIQYTLNGTLFGEVEAFDLGATATSGGDDFEIDMDGNISYPEVSLISADVVDWSGSGTFTLTTETYETFFIAGSYSDGTIYQVNIAAPTTVPEPSSTLLLGLGSLALLARRRK